MKSPFDNMAEAEGVFFETMALAGVDFVGFHRWILVGEIALRVKDRRFGSRYVEFGDAEEILGLTFETGGLIAHRLDQPLEEIVQWTGAGGLFDALSDLAEVYALAKLEAFKAMIGPYPPTLAALHGVTSFLRHGCHPTEDPGKTRKLAYRKLKYPKDLHEHVALAALNLNAGAAIARFDPALIERTGQYYASYGYHRHPLLRHGHHDHGKMLDILTVSHQDAGRQWAQDHCPELGYLFE